MGVTFLKNFVGSLPFTYPRTQKIEMGVKNSKIFKLEICIYKEIKKLQEIHARFRKRCPWISEGIKIYNLTRSETDLIAYKNKEGYPDPVPYEAIKNMEPRHYRPMVYICSPYSGNVEENIEKARRYSRFAVDQGAIPIAPHLLFPQFMNEATERELAMFMDIAVLSKCRELWVFDIPTAGMRREIAYAEKKQMVIRFFREDE